LAEKSVYASAESSLPTSGELKTFARKGELDFGKCANAEGRVFMARVMKGIKG
jgi:hypothetical protein